jgi:hypothetical protein
MLLAPPASRCLHQVRRDSAGQRRGGRLDDEMSAFDDVQVES